MKLRLVILILSIHFFTIAYSSDYDIVIVGATPGGIMTAISAARQGKTALLLERTSHIGGLPANGLGATDIATRGATTGLFQEFTKRIKQYYVDTYGIHSAQVADCSDGFHFEPSVAESVFTTMLDECNDKITVLTMRQFDSYSCNVEISDSVISSIKVINRLTGAEECYSGRMFADATYEGDLGAAAGVPFRVGREPASMYNEPGAGKVYEYWKSQPADGSTGEGDNAVQAYNYRLCLTDCKDNLAIIKKPSNYDREEYVSLIEDVWTGRNTHFVMRNITDSMMWDNRKHIAEGGRTQLAGDSWGIRKISSIVRLPNGKADGNNQHGAFISTDLPEENWEWPTASWTWRDAFAARLKDYTLGLLWFAGNDSALPAHFREAVAQWGFAKDEYIDNDNFPRQVYVREGRRFEGMYFFTAADALPVAPGQRPPVHSESITASHYALDSHAARKREPGRAHLDGFISYQTEPYTVPYGVIVPKNVKNLLLPVPVSGSHIGFSTLRMEPCWMALGQAAGTAAAIAIDDSVSVQNVDIRRLQENLLRQKVTLVYFRDITPDNPGFADAQRMALSGKISGWDADIKSRPWALGPFQRPDGVNPLLEASQAEFTCPMRGVDVKWEEGHVFNPAAVMVDDRIAVLYRAEDNSGNGIGKRTSRIGYAESSDGITITRRCVPVLYPGGDSFTDIDCPGGCEDPRIAVTEDGLYVMLYTSWNRRTPRLSVATSRDLIHWQKHGSAFSKAYDGRFSKIATKSASILTALKNSQLVIDKVDGKYFMYWGEYAVHAATSDNLIDWTPIVDDDGELVRLALPRTGYFDSQMTECGPPAVRTPYGIVLIYNGKNDAVRGDKMYPSGAYCAGQMLFDADNPLRLIDRLDCPFFQPETSFEKSGQYRDGTVFTEGLVYKNGLLYIYYGCADSKVAVAVADGKNLIEKNLN